MPEPGEPYWLDEDTDAALEWMAHRESLCSGCSHPRNETFDPEGPNYTATALRCRACAARDREVRSWHNEKDADTAGVYFLAVEA